MSSVELRITTWTAKSPIAQDTFQLIPVSSGTPEWLGYAISNIIKKLPSVSKFFTHEAFFLTLPPLWRACSKRVVNPIMWREKILYKVVSVWYLFQVTGLCIMIRVITYVLSIFLHLQGPFFNGSCGAWLVLNKTGPSLQCCQYAG